MMRQATDVDIEYYGGQYCTIGLKLPLLESTVGVIRRVRYVWDPTGQMNDISLGSVMLN